MIGVMGVYESYRGIKIFLKMLFLFNVCYICSVVFKSMNFGELELFGFEF